MNKRLLWLLFAVALPAAAAGPDPSARVAPPPLPLGSSMMRIEGGMSPPERQRQIRAHHHKGHYKKDHTRDDTQSVAAPAPRKSASAPAARKRHTH